MVTGRAVMFALAVGAEDSTYLPAFAPPRVPVMVTVLSLPTSALSKVAPEGVKVRSSPSTLPLIVGVPVSVAVVVPS